MYEFFPQKSIDTLKSMKLAMSKKGITDIGTEIWDIVE